MALDYARLKNTLLLQRRPLLMGIAFLVASLAILIFGAYPMWGNIETVQTNLRQEQSALDRMRQRANLVSSISEEDTRRFDIASDALPSQKEPLVTIRHLQALAAQSQVSLSMYDINPGLISTGSAAQEQSSSRRTRERRSSSAAQPLDIETEFSGTFGSIRRLIQLLEDSRPILEIQTLSLDPERRVAGATGENMRYVAKIRLRSYYAVFDPRALVAGGVQPLSRDQQKTLEMLESMRTFLPQSQDGGRSTIIPEGGFTNTDIFGLQPSGQNPEDTPILTGDGVPQNAPRTTDLEESAAPEEPLPEDTEVPLP